MLKNKIRDSIRVRFMLVFMGTLLLAALFTFPTIVIGESWLLASKTQNRLTTSAEQILQLRDEEGMTPEKIAYYAGSDTVGIAVCRTPEAADPQADPEILSAMKEGDSWIPETRLNEQPRMVLKCGGVWYVLNPSQEDSQFRSMIGTIFRVLWSCMIIGSLLILLTVRTVTDPVRRLNEATNRVAKGDFDVRLPETARDELGRLTRNFNRMTEQLKKMETLRNDFVSCISHEFKTPLASIQGFAKLLQDKNLPPEKAEEYTQVILEESTRLTTLSSNILRLNALENRTIPHKAVAFSMDEQIRRSVLLLEPQWEPREIEFDLELADMPYYGDQELLQQVWVNLVGNAIKFSPKGSTVHLSLKKDHGKVRFVCRDEGVGIAEEELEHIFEKFYQADPSRAKEGNGLGLAIVKQILNLCGGTVHCESRPGEGAAFHVELPEALPPDMDKRPSFLKEQ